MKFFNSLLLLPTVLLMAAAVAEETSEQNNERPHTLRIFTALRKLKTSLRGSPTEIAKEFERELSTLSDFVSLNEEAFAAGELVDPTPEESNYGYGTYGNYGYGNYGNYGNYGYGQYGNYGNNGNYGVRN